MSFSNNEYGSITARAPLKWCHPISGSLGVTMRAGLKEKLSWNLWTIGRQGWKDAQVHLVTADYDSPLPPRWWINVMSKELTIAHSRLAYGLIDQLCLAQPRNPSPLTLVTSWPVSRGLSRLRSRRRSPLKLSPRRDCNGR